MRHQLVHVLPFSLARAAAPVGRSGGRIPDFLTKRRKKGGTRMIVFRKFHVKKDERALLFNRGDFVEILRPGEHLRFDPLRRLAVEKFALANTRFEHRLADFLVKEEPEIVAREFHVVELGPAEVGLRYENGVLAEVLAPNTRRLYWKGYIELAFERIDIATEFAVEPKLVPQLVVLGSTGFKAKVTGADVYGVQVPQFNVGVLYVDGKLHVVLEPGL